MADGDHNELWYTAKDVQTMMKNPKVFHLGDELNRKKICYFIDKYVTGLYGSHYIQLWAAKNQSRTIFDLIKMSDLAYTVAVIENRHEIWEQCNEGQHVSSEVGQERWERDQKNRQLRRPPSSQRELGKRENITHQDGIMRR